MESTRCETFFKQVSALVSTLCMTLLFPKAKVILVLGPVGYGKSSFAAELARAIGGVHIDGDDFLPREVVLGLGCKRNASTVAAVMAAICAGKVPVLSTGGGAAWHFPPWLKDKQKLNESFLEYVAKQMGIELDLIVFVPEDIKAYDDADAVRTAIQERKGRGESWPDGDKLNKLIDGSAGNRQFAKEFSDVAKEKVFPFPRCRPGNVPKLSELRVEQQLFDTVAARIWEQWFTVCEEVEPIVPDRLATLKNLQKAYKTLQTRELLHRTIVSHDEGTVGPIPGPVASGEVDAQMVFCIKPDGKPLATFVALPDAPESHLTVAAGAYKPESMKALALAVSAEETSATLTTQKGQQETVEFLYWKQPVKVVAHAVVPFV